MRYSLDIQATWTEGSSNPQGGHDKRDFESKDTHAIFEASSLQEAQEIARQKVTHFWKSLPKKRQNSFTWQNEDPRVSATLAEIKTLEYKDLLVPSKQEKVA